MENTNLKSNDHLSAWWRRGILLILLLEFAVLIWIATGTYVRDVGPPIPESIEDTNGTLIFTGDDIVSGQELFLKKALMNNGTIWGHGAYLGPDFSAEYLHNLALETRKYLSVKNYDRPLSNLNEAEKAALQKITY
ncbi:MAG TPA: hypothetical protein VKA38_13395, partial [Draconibacterium sp.]|nr:hypothetical protein [Draconibacterium sp.]